MDDKTKALLSETKQILKSLLIPNQMGVNMRQLCSEFYEMEGKSVPYKELGFNSLTDFLRSISDVLRMHSSARDPHNVIIYPVVDESTRHIYKMVGSQKKQPKRRNESPRSSLRYVAKARHLDLTKLVISGNNKTKAKANGDAMKTNGDSMNRNIETVASVETMISKIESILSVDKLKAWVSTGLHDEYFNRFKERLPPNWIELIKDRFDVSEIRASNVTKTLIALKLNIKKRDSVSSTSSSPNPDEINSNGIQVMPESLQLPDTETWDVIISYPINTSEIYLRLIDTSEDYAQLRQEMHTHYQSKSKAVKQAIEGKIYVIHFADATFRVMAKSINKEMVKCFFIDEGDTYDVNQSNLHEIDSRFLKLPFQAFCCSLSEIEYYKTSSKATEKLISEIYASEEPVFICKPITREHPISMTLYDVVDDYDRDINEEIITFMQTHAFDDILTKVNSQCEVYVSYCTQTGDIYVQIDHPFYKKYENLKEKANELCNVITNVPDIDLLREEMTKTTKTYYYAKCDGEWFRCLIHKVKSDMEIMVHFVDFGDRKVVAQSDIRSLVSDIDPLKTIPYLALKVRLNCDGIWSDKISQLFMNLMQSDLQTMKVVQPINEDINATIVELWDDSILISEKLAFDMNNPIVSNGNSSQPLNGIASQPFNGNASQPLKPYQSDKISALNVVTNEAIEDDVITGGKDIPKPKLPKINPNPSDNDDFFDVVVLRAATPYNFIVVPYANICSDDSEFFKMKSNMYEFYEKEENRIDLPQLVLKKGIYVAGKFNNYWNRIKIVEFHNHNPVEVMALLIDYGDIQHFELKDIQPLFNEFRSLPIQAIAATLATVEPINLDLWDQMACFEFSRIVKNKPFVATVHDIKRLNDEPLLMLSLVDTSGETDVHIEECLIERELAQRKKRLSF